MTTVLGTILLTYILNYKIIKFNIDSILFILAFNID